MIDKATAKDLITEALNAKERGDREGLAALKGRLEKLRTAR